MSIASWVDGTAFNGSKHNQKILSTLVEQTSDDQQAFLQKLKNEQTPLSMETLFDVSKAIDKFDASSLFSKKRKTPLTQQGFYDAIEQGLTDYETVKTQLTELKQEAQKQKGYLSKAFSIFSKEKPIEEVMTNVVSFEKYCRKNNITFDEAEQKLKVGQDPNTLTKKMIDFRFLMAAGAGLALGLSGVGLGGVPLLGAAPGVFFGNMHYVAMPFICLNIFKAFSEKNILKESKTMLGFAGTMAAGFAISLGVTAGMSDMLPDLSDVIEADASGDAPTRGFSLYDYLIQGIAGSAAFATVYGGCKKVMGIQEPSVEHVDPVHVDHKPGMLERGFKAIFNSKAVQKTKQVVSDFGKSHVSPKVDGFLKAIAPAVNPVGKVLEKATGISEKVFGKYMDFIGIPATLSLVSQSFSTGGMAALGQFAGYFGVVGLGMMATAAVIGGLSYMRYKLRGKEFKAMLNTAATAFSLSSSAATMPTTKKNLKEMGVSEKTANSVVPLGANFNMMGTSLYLGTTAACAAVMFGIPMTPELAVTVAGIVISTAFGVAGAPASNLSLLDPVLAKMDLPEQAVQKVFSMVLPADRPLDMAQTSLNVCGDKIVAMEVDGLHHKNRAKFAARKAKANAPKL